MPRRVMIVDDEPVIRDYLSDYLRRRGFRTCTAENGARALALLEKRSVDLVLTDLVMPDQEGIETIRVIRTRFPGMRIVAMSGALHQGTYLGMARTLGADRTLVKPLTGEEVTEVIRDLLPMMN